MKEIDESGVIMAWCEKRPLSRAAEEILKPERLLFEKFVFSKGNVSGRVKNLFLLCSSSDF